MGVDRVQWRPIRLVERVTVAPSATRERSGSIITDASRVSLGGLSRTASTDSAMLRLEGAAGNGRASHPLMRARLLVPMREPVAGPLAAAAAATGERATAGTGAAAPVTALRPVWVPVARVLVDWLVAQTQLARSLAQMAFLWPRCMPESANEPSLAELWVSVRAASSFATGWSVASGSEGGRVCSPPRIRRAPRGYRGGGGRSARCSH